MIDAFTKVVLACACLFTFAWVILAQRRTIRRLSDAYLRLTHFQRAVVVLTVIVCTVYAQKPSTNDVEGVSSGTNDVEIVEGGDTNGVGGIVLNAPQPMSNGSAFLGGCGGPGVSALPPVGIALRAIRNEIAFYELVNVTTNANYSYAMPADGTIRGTWHLTGAYEDVQKVALDGFAFPLGTDLCSSLWAYTWGKVRSQLKNTSNEIAAVGAPMSAIPDVSRFWTATTTNDTYLLTWENFALGRIAALTNTSSLIPDPSSLVSAQLELKRNGDFITRSNEVESVWRRRMPCDLDEDGWIDLVDPDPVVFDEDGFGPHQTLPEGDNTNYYYWVDLVVDQANARVTFEGEGHSALPDPDFIARAGETNRVMLLIGKPYVVNCDFPIRCVDKEDDEIEVSGMGNSLGILWPIYLDFVPTEPLLLFAGPLLGAPSNGGGDTGVSIHPERAGGGDFSWPDNFCCYTTAADGSPIFCCDGNCGCGGCHTGDITYRIGEHELAYGGWSCGCSHEPDDPHDADPPDDPPSGPSVSATFSHDAIIFEDEYENSPGVFVPRHSTEVEAEFYVYGGTNGGSYAFTLTDGGRLQRLGGSYVPRNGTVDAGEDFHIKVRYDAVSASGSEGDVKAKVEFTENGSGRKISKEAALTAVKVELITASYEPENRQRHVYGVGEEVFCVTQPEDCSVTWTSNVSGALTDGKLTCPLLATTLNLSVTCKGVTYEPHVSLVEPQAIECRQATMQDFSFPVNVAGGAGLALELYILPDYVSFYNIAVQEIPANGTHDGYYDNSVFAEAWNHTQAHRAGEWKQIRPDNFYMRDDASWAEVMPRMTPSGALTNDVHFGWREGHIRWPIPMGWQDKTARETDWPELKRFGGPYEQVFGIEPNGTVSVSKHGHFMSRSTNDVIIVDNEIKKGTAQ